MLETSRNLFFLIIAHPLSIFTFVQIQLMKKISSFLALCFICILFLFGCKKGEEDPSFSLRSRKERISGDWELVRGFVASTNKNTIINTTYNGTSFTTTSSQNPNLVINGAYSRTLSINKEGTFVEDIYQDNQNIKEQGTWTFLSGNKLENLKNKEAVLFKISSTFNSIGNILNQFEGSECPLRSIRLKKLASKEMIWEINGKQDELIVESELTWKLR
jgi:hypothetical protein